MNKRTIYLVFLILFLLSLVKIIMSAKLATAGAELAAIEQQSKELAISNREYGESILTLTSLNRIYSEATKLGLTQVIKSLTLAPDEPIALQISR